MADRNITKNEFSRLDGLCYLDHVGSALYSDSQMDSIVNDLKSNVYGNPHSLNTASRLTHDTVEQIRFRILNHFNTNSDEYHIIFTSGATEALKSVTEWFDWKRCKKFDDNCKHPTECCCNTQIYDGDNGCFVYTQDNHTSVLGLREIANQNAVEVHCLRHYESFRIFRNSKYRCRRNPTNDRYYSGNSLFVYSAQCNFSGIKYPLEWIEKVHNGILDDVVNNDDVNKKRYRWFCLLDAATYVSTNQLDLSLYKPDFVAVSFYKIFGYPTGLGAILVKNSSVCVLNKKYYGGGTVLLSLSDTQFHVKRPTLHERCEDGTINFLSIVSLIHGIDTIERLAGGMKYISLHVFKLTQYLHENLLKLHHSNGSPVIKLYHDTDYSSARTQGNIVNFNVLRHNGDYVGYFEVLNMANLHNIYLRTGCFCNPGACQRHLKLRNDELKANYQAGHTCANNLDLINGYPTGSIRVSFGYMSDVEDANRLIKMIVDCFVSHPLIMKYPENWNEKSISLRNKFSTKRSSDNSVNDEDMQLPNCRNYIPNCMIGFDPFITRSDNARTFNMPANLKLSKIIVYPVKSCSPCEDVDEWPLCETGLKYDRCWMIVNHVGIYVTQLKQPKLCFIKPRLNFEDNTLRLTYADIEDSEISVPLDVEETSSRKVCLKENKICGDKVQAIDCGDEIADWLSDYVGIPGLRLVKEFNKKRKTATDVILPFSNSAQILLVNEASVSWLAEQLQDYSYIDLSTDSLMRRFRPNLIISGDAEPLDEQFWKDIVIGSTSFKIDGPCTRCHMICVNQFTAEKNKEVLTTLSKALSGKVVFGIYLSIHPEATNKYLKLNEPIIPTTRDKYE